MSGGQAWWSEILARVRRCDVFVIALTPESLKSVACTRKCGYAAALHKPILPVLAGGDVAINLLPPQLARIHFVDYRQRDDRTVALHLARAFAALPRGIRLPEPLPPEPDVPMSYLGGLNEQIGGSASLSYDQQSGLILDLKRGLRESETLRDALELLGRLRQRRDLFATLAADIDELLAGASDSSAVKAGRRWNPAASPAAVADATVSSQPPPQTTQTQQPGPAAGTKNATSPKQHAPQKRAGNEHASDSSISWREKILAAVVCFLLVVFFGMLARATPSGTGAGRGSIAGAIGGLRRRYLGMVMIGGALGFLTGLHFAGNSRDAPFIWAAGGVIVGALVGHFLLGFRSAAPPESSRLP